MVKVIMFHGNKLQVAVNVVLAVKYGSANDYVSYMSINCLHFILPIIIYNVTKP